MFDRFLSLTMIPMCGALVAVGLWVAYRGVASGDGVQKSLPIFAFVALYAWRGFGAIRHLKEDCQERATRKEEVRRDVASQLATISDLDSAISALRSRWKFESLPQHRRIVEADGSNTAVDLVSREFVIRLFAKDRVLTSYRVE